MNEFAWMWDKESVETEASLGTVVRFSSVYGGGRLMAIVIEISVYTQLEA